MSRADLSMNKSCAEKRQGETVRVVLELPSGFIAELAEQVAAKVNGGASAPGPEQWLDVEGAAAHMGVPKSRVYDLCHRRESTCFPVRKDGARSYFRASELDAWREGQC
jgi:hypothetical protein